MWRTNIATLVAHRPVFSLDLLGDAGLSVQSRPIAGAADQARWLDEVIAGLGLQRVHLLGVSMGGWLATNGALRRPNRIASIMLLDPAMTFGRIPAKAVIASIALVVPGFPARARRRVMSWLGGGAAVDETLPEAVLLDAASRGFVLRLPAPRLFGDSEMRSLTVPALAIIAGRSVIHHPGRAAAGQWSGRSLVGRLACDQRRIPGPHRQSLTPFLRGRRAGSPTGSARLRAVHVGLR
jgi:pimeloyl-ACP methyl ester carboxylesterase